MSKGKILVTGGLGYIGSHTVVEMVAAGYEPLVIDNLSESDLSVKGRIEKITGEPLLFEEVEMCDRQALRSCFERHPDLRGVIHFAAFLLVNESVQDPLKYYHNNLSSTINLLYCMQEFKVHPIVFSSSCTVYGNPDTLPVNEQAPVKPAVSPYGNTKKIGEDILEDCTRASDIKVISLRYFNPIGAHHSAIIGEFQDGEPHHLVPYITETARGLRKELRVFGSDWNTPDGTCLRDYLHVVDVATAHIAALRRMLEEESPQYEVFNLGMGVGVSVLEMIHAFTEATGIEIPYRLSERREGDVEAVYADTTLANTVLGWRTEKSLKECMADAWRWEQALMQEKGSE